MVLPSALPKSLAANSQSWLAARLFEHGVGLSLGSVLGEIAKDLAELQPVNPPNHHSMCLVMYLGGHLPVDICSRPLGSLIRHSRQLNLPLRVTV